MAHSRLLSEYVFKWTQVREFVSYPILWISLTVSERDCQYRLAYYLKRNVYWILTYFKESNWCRTPSLRPVIWKAWRAWAHVIYSISKEDKNQVLGCEPRTEEPVPFFKQNGRTKWFSFPLTVLESALFRRCRRNTVVKYSDRVSCTTMHSNTATESAGDMLQRDQC